MQLRVTGGLVVWVVTGLVVLSWLQSGRQSSAEHIAEIVGKKEPPPRVSLESNDYARAFIPFYNLTRTDKEDQKDLPDWVRAKRDELKESVRLFHLARLFVTGLGGFLFANKFCGKQRFVQAAIRLGK